LYTFSGIAEKSRLIVVGWNYMIHSLFSTTIVGNRKKKMKKKDAYCSTVRRNTKKIINMAYKFVING
jgi:spermidine/putrescine-binding protein